MGLGLLFGIPSLLICLMPQVAQAHHVMEGGSFTNGLSYPIHGLDHLLAIVAVGLWAALNDGRRRLGIFAGFNGALLIGAALGMARLGFPLVEQGILLSIVAIGLLIAVTFQGAAWLLAGLATLFAVFHGYAGGAEMPAENGAIIYSLGYLVCTLLLQGGGLAFGIFLCRQEKLPVVRAIGAAVCVIGVLLMVGVIHP